MKFKSLSRPMANFQALFKANLVFKYFSRQPFFFKYFSSLWEPCNGLWVLMYPHTDCGYMMGTHVPTIYALSKNNKLYLLKFFIFYNFRKICILHGHLFLITSYVHLKTHIHLYLILIYTVNRIARLEQQNFNTF